MENREASVAHMGDNYLMKVCAKWTRNENSLRMPNGLIKVLGSVVDTRIENFFMNQEIFSHETVYVWIQNDLLPKLPHEFRPILWDDQ
uniref:Uncharacterized protein n=1 Tax=Acrobeloides nanus TaxID=290746 RepID=A0A914DY25_9BILA